MKEGGTAIVLSQFVLHYPLALYWSQKLHRTQKHANERFHADTRGTNSTCKSDGGDSDGQGTPQGGRGVRSTPPP